VPEEPTVSPGTLSRLLWHAGLEDRPGPLRSVSWATYPKGRLAPDLAPALADLLDAMSDLNLELNPDPEAVEGKANFIPRQVAYAISEIVRMLRDCAADAPADEALHLERAAWRIDTVWSAILAGDEPDVTTFLRHTEGFLESLP
jgi:hypothetical protein